MRSFFAVLCLLLGYSLGFLTQRATTEEKFELLYLRTLLLQERLRLQGVLLDAEWRECVGVEEARGAGR